MPLIHGRFGYGVPRAKLESAVLGEVADSIAKYSPADAPSSVLKVNTTAPESSMGHELNDPGGVVADDVPGDHGRIDAMDNSTALSSSVDHQSDDPGGGVADDDPGGSSRW